MASSSLALGFMPWLAFKHDGKEFPSINTSFFDLNGYLLKEDVYSYQPTSLGVRVVAQAIQWTAETLGGGISRVLNGGILW